MGAWEAIGKSDEWYTPKSIFNGLGCWFDLDVAHPGGGMATTHVPCAAYLHERALEYQWAGFVWMNPPFGGRNGIVPWLDKFFTHGNGIALVPDRTSAPWWQDAACKSSALLFMSPKVKFEKPDGSVGKSPGCGTTLMAAGMRARSILFRAGSLGFVAQGNTPSNE